jgi:uncharacterized membrane-anchored protein
MNSRLTRGLIVVGALLVLGSVNYSIYAKERTKREGEIVFLELVPVDPRSLMQGDYMALQFAVADGIRMRRATAEKEQFTGSYTAAMRVDGRRIATLAENETDGSVRIRYRVRSGQIWLGTNAYFFEEGAAQRFAGARYGEFRVDRNSGEAVLVGLRGGDLERL